MTSRGYKAGSGAGPGSLPEVLQDLIQWLPKIVHHYRIKTVNDAGAGKQMWIKEVQWDVDYKAYDEHQWNDDITILDITKEKMRKCDLVICKDVFRHLTDKEIEAALALFDTKYIVADTVPGAPVGKKNNRSVDMTRFLGEPLDVVSSAEPSKRAKGKCFGVWKKKRTYKKRSSPNK